jgi:hypothetical protein
MSFFSWLRNTKSNRGARGRSQRRSSATRFRPQIEVLESRDVPSTLHVTGLGDQGPGTLRYEIAVANSGDTIDFVTSTSTKKKAPPPSGLTGTITLESGELVINKNLTIQGPGWGTLTITSPRWADSFGNGYNGSRIFEVDGAGTTVAISGLTLTSGGGTRYGNGVSGYPNDGYGGAILNFGSLTLSNCKLGGGLVYGNTAHYGGAIANFGQMTVSGCNVDENSAIAAFHSVAEGGGIYNAGTMTVSGGWVQGNSATYGTLGVGAEGGGIYNAGTLTVSGGYVVYNSAGTGGGIYNAGAAAALTVLDSIFGNYNPDNIFGPYTDGGGNTFK